MKLGMRRSKKLYDLYNNYAIKEVIFLQENKKEITLWAYCYCEKTENSLRCGFDVTGLDLSVELPDLGGVVEGISDSFWELYFEYEPGVEKAHKLVKEGKCANLKQALLETFGHFHIRYEMEDAGEEDLDYKIDADELMYSLLEEL